MHIDWSEAPDVEVIPGKVSGAPILVGTRIPADAIAVNYESAMRHGMTPDEALEETSENYPSAGIQRIKNLLEYYYAHQPQHQP